jgi:hypothetical protein
MARQAGVKPSMHRPRKGFGCRVAKTPGKGNAPVPPVDAVNDGPPRQLDGVLQDAINELT